MSTLGTDNHAVCARVGRAIVPLLVFDGAGLAVFDATARHEMRKAHLVLLVFDITSFESFRALTASRTGG
jgi:GTPase SAR1 family protein